MVAVRNPAEGRIGSWIALRITPRVAGPSTGAYTASVVVGGGLSTGRWCGSGHPQVQEHLPDGIAQLVLDLSLRHISEPTRPY